MVNAEFAWDSPSPFFPQINKKYIYCLKKFKNSIPKFLSFCPICPLIHISLKSMLPFQWTIKILDLFSIPFSAQLHFLLSPNPSARAQYQTLKWGLLLWTSLLLFLCTMGKKSGIGYLWVCEKKPVIKVTSTETNLGLLLPEMWSTYFSLFLPGSTTEIPKIT